MRQYHDLLQRVRTEGVRKDDRAGAGTRAVFGHQQGFKLSEGFPLVTSRKLRPRPTVHDLIWFPRGDTNMRYLRKGLVTIWEKWAEEKRDPGPVYGRR